MCQCWAFDKQERPSFAECKNVLGELLYRKFPQAAKSLLDIFINCQPYVNITNHSQERLSCTHDDKLYLTSSDLNSSFI